MGIINVDNSAQPPRILSLCSGYGGLEIGLEKALGKIRILAHVEIEAFAIANLVDKMETGQMVPAPIWTDLKTFNARIFRGSVDILTGGFPCQPFSCAGKQWGTDDPRHLWPFIEKSIKECGSRKVWFENVEGLISTKTLLHRPELLRYCREVEQRLGPTWGLAFRRRLTKLCGISVLQYVKWRLERLGYKCESGIFSAEEVGAPHQRKRVFILADSELRSGQAGGEPTRRETGSNSERCSEQSELGKPSGERLQITRPRGEREPHKEEGKGLDSGFEQPSDGKELGNSESSEKQRIPEQISNRSGKSDRFDESKFSHKNGEKWPAFRGQPQHEWEEPRIVDDTVL